MYKAERRFDTPSLFLTANRRPVSFLFLTLGHTFGVRVQRVLEKVLKMDRPLAGGFLSLTGLWPEGCGGGFAASLLKSALRDWLSMSYGMISILRIGSLRSPPPIRLRRTFPHPGDRINRSMLSCRDMAPRLSTHSPTTEWGEGGGVSHQRGNAFPRPQGGCMVFAAKGGIKNGAEGAVPRQRARSANQ